MRCASREEAGRRRESFYDRLGKTIRSGEIYQIPHDPASWIPRRRMHDLGTWHLIKVARSAMRTGGVLIRRKFLVFIYRPTVDLCVPQDTMQYECYDCLQGMLAEDQTVKRTPDARRLAFSPERGVDIL